MRLNNAFFEAIVPPIPRKQRFNDNFVVLGSTLVLNFLGLAMPLAVLQVYDGVIGNAAVETLAAVGLSLVIVATLEFILRVAQNYVMTLDAQRYGHHATVQAIDNELLDGNLHDHGLSAERRMEKFRALDGLIEYLSGDNRRALVDLPFSFVFLTALALIGGWLVFAPIVVLLIAAVSSNALLRRSREATMQKENSAERSAEFLAEIFASIPTIKSLGAEALMARRHERLSAGAAAHFRTGLVASSDLQAAIGAFTAIGSLSTLAAGALLVMDGDLSVGALAACSMLAARALQPILRSVSAMAERQNAVLHAQACAELFGKTTAPNDAKRSIGPRTHGPAQLTMKNVTLSLNEKIILDETSLSPRKGRVTLISAENFDYGVELMRALAGLREPDSGVIEIDGNPASWARQGAGAVSMVTPSSRLFRGTIIENLTLFGDGVDVDDALAAVSALGLDKTLNAQPKGYETQIATPDSGDETLSPELQSQIALARALAHMPRLLLLDRPFAYIDGDQSRARLLDILKRMRETTTILIQTDEPGFEAIADARLEAVAGLCALKSLSDEDSR